VHDIYMVLRFTDIKYKDNYWRFLSALTYIYIYIYMWIIVRTIKRRKGNWIGHILRRNCLLKHVIEGKSEGRIEMTGRRGRRRKQLLYDHKEKRNYWKLKEESTRSHPLENWFWKRLRTCRKTYYRMNE
jgi:hypothetical protein